MSISVIFDILFQSKFQLKHRLKVTTIDKKDQNNLVYIDKNHSDSFLNNLNILFLNKRPRLNSIKTSHKTTTVTSEYSIIFNYLCHRYYISI
jgi:hypothetical protein